MKAMERMNKTQVTSYSSFVVTNVVATRLRKKQTHLSGTIIVMRILLLLVSLALVGGDYAPSPQNPFVNVTHVPSPPAASIPSSNGSSLAAPHGFTFTTKKLVLTILGTIVGTFLMLGAIVACIWFIVKCLRKRKNQNRSSRTTVAANWQSIGA
ncbi:transmembrane protein, putative [Medicago truncatula]|uniref:Transmembrane protein, putative n=1 Tax=Medicago truncatula TaxID=3880 RepID=A0A072TG42_MEDTR|nr:transmembrane protein, putative [Medicago truncatula]